MGGIQGRESSGPVLHHMIGNLVTDLHLARTILHDVARLDGEAVTSSRRALPPNSPYRSSLVPADEGPPCSESRSRRSRQHDAPCSAAPAPEPEIILAAHRPARYRGDEGARAHKR
jgi:hypothetical protein